MTNKEKEIEQFKRSINAVAETPDGRAVLRYIMRECGHNMSSVVQDPQSLEINMVSTVWNEAKRDVYTRLRSFIDKKNLIEIEFTED